MQLETLSIAGGAISCILAVETWRKLRVWFMIGVHAAGRWAP